jgi:hypothetical protein
MKKAEEAVTSIREYYPGKLVVILLVASSSPPCPPCPPLLALL